MNSLARQLDLVAVDLGAAGADVEPDAAGLELERRLARLRRPQARAHAGEQLLEHERLGHVVVGAAVEPGHGVDDLVARGEDQHRQLLAARAQRAQHGEAVLAGQADVEDQQVELLVARDRTQRTPSSTTVVL